MAVGASSFWLGELTRARAYLEQGLTFYGPLQNAPIAFRSDADLGPIYLSYISLILWELGYSDQAQQKSQEALVWAQQLAHPFCLAQTLLWRVQLHQCMKEAQIILELTENMLALSKERGFALYTAAALFRQGWALTIGGQIEAGIAQMRRGLADIQVTGAGLRQPTLLGYLAESYGRVGRVSEGLCIIDEALILMQQTAECWWEAELYRLKAELLLTLPVDHQGEAETCLWRALNLAHHQQSKALELRATISLSRLWQRQGKADRACQMLTEVYSWFTEGLTTRDLREAQALLEAF
jgi:predicted ATPase